MVCATICLTSSNSLRFRENQQTLEKCRACLQPITDKIIATDTDTFHASCFNCKECGRNLDGVNFAVNKFNEHHCVPCFHQ